MKKPTIVFVGHVCIDHNTIEDVTYASWGSPSVYMTKYFQQALALNPTIIATYGPDFVPYADGITLCPQTPNAPTTLIYENVVKNGQRTQYCHLSETAKPAPLTEAAKALLQSADILFVAPLSPNYTTPYIADVIANLPTDCLRVLLPQGYLRHIDSNDLVQSQEFERAPDILPHFDLVILSDEDHPQAMTQAHKWKQLSPHTQFVVTQNVRGASIIQATSSTHVPTIPIPNESIVDSIGSGDVFSAATAYHLYITRDIVVAIQRGHEAARKKLLDTASKE